MSSDTHDKRIIDPPCEGQDSISQDAMRHLMDQIVNVLPRVRINTTNVVRHIDDPEDDLFTGSQEACKKWISERILETNKLITLDNKKAPKMKTQIPLLMKDDFKTMKQHQIASEGNGWNIPKLHALLHLVEMVTKHGVMANSNGGPCESHFRLNIKKPAKTIQRRNATFACDTLRSYGRQIAQTQAFRYIPEYVNSSEIRNTVESISVRGSSFQIGYNASKRTCISKWVSKRMKGRQLLYPEATLKFVAERFFTNLHFNGGRLADEDKIECYTEAIFNGDKIRAHPNYQSEGKNFDWISVKYESLIVPAVGSVLMIFDFRKQKFLSKSFLKEKYGASYFPSGNRVENDVYLLMKFTKDTQPPANIGHCNVKQKLRLLKRFVMDDEPTYDLVPLTSFLSSTYELSV